MKKASWLGIIVLLLVTGCGDVDSDGIVCQSYIVNFDTDPQGFLFINRQLLSTEYASWGVIFSLPFNSPRIIDQSADLFDAIPVSPPFLLGGNFNTGLSQLEPLTIDFLQLASRVQFYIVGAESGGGSAIFFDSIGNILDIQFFQSLPSGAAQLIFSPVTGVASILLTNSSLSDEFFVDDLEYDLC
jgi:hypothetical protein